MQPAMPFSILLKRGKFHPACRLPTRSDSLAVAREIATDEAAARAIQFGARQLLSQHRGLFDLLKARAEIRTLD